MEYADIIIIGAGAAGLMAAKDISFSGKSVIILEADNRIGGRIYTVYNKDFPEPVQLGAEFIHGNLPLTIALLKEAKIKFDSVKGTFYRFSKGKLQTENDAFAGWSHMMQKMKMLKEDMSLQDFLNTYFTGEKNADFRKSVANYTSGYDAADPRDASTLGLLNEWENEDEDQYQIRSGYIELVNYLQDSSIDRGCRIMLSDAVKTVNWRAGYIEAITASGRIYNSSKMIVTVPLGILQKKASDSNYIAFYPEIHRTLEIANRIGFGSVIKIVIRFTETFWKTEKQKNKMRFILSDEKIPTWWTHTKNLPIITGWLGGPNAQQVRGENAIMSFALQSLAFIFNIDKTVLEKMLASFNYCNWADESFVGGAYSYPKAGHHTAKIELNMPVDHTIYIAGEACCIGKASGTVEAALISGRQVAEKILS
jgi:monoamine oxidase